MITFLQRLEFLMYLIHIQIFVFTPYVRKRSKTNFELDFTRSRRSSTYRRISSLDNRGSISLTLKFLISTLSALSHLKLAKGPSSSQCSPCTPQWPLSTIYTVQHTFPCKIAKKIRSLNHSNQVMHFHYHVADY
jgi:hypothetical protein